MYSEKPSENIQKFLHFQFLSAEDHTILKQLAMNTLSCCIGLSIAETSGNDGIIDCVVHVWMLGGAQREETESKGSPGCLQNESPLSRVVMMKIQKLKTSRHIDKSTSTKTSNKKMGSLLMYITHALLFIDSLKPGLPDELIEKCHLFQKLKKNLKQKDFPS